MSKKKKAYVGAMEEDASMDMSPMIDMVFLLLIFFVVNSTAIKVEMIPSVSVPTATNSSSVESVKGFIVVNVWGEVRPDGVSPDINFGEENGNPLATDQELADYLKKKVEEDAAYLKPEEHKLYIRGDQQAVFKYARKAITLAGGLGISDIVFGVLPPNPGS